MPERDDLAWDALVGDVYASVMDEAAAIRLPVSLAGLLSGSVAAFWTLDPLTTAVVGDIITNLPTEAVRLYAEHYYRNDPFTDALALAPRNVVFRGAEYAPDTLYARSLYYNEFGAHHGMFHMMGALMPVGTGQEVGVVSVLRPRSLGSFEDKAIRRLSRILPHLRGALRLRAQMITQGATQQVRSVNAVLEALQTPALILDGNARILQSNEQAQRIPFVRASLPRGGFQGGLCVPDAVAQQRFSRMSSDAALGGAGGMLRLSADGQWYIVTITPMLWDASPAGRPAPGRVLVILRRLERDVSDRVRSLAVTVFGLTQAEASAAAALVSGCKPNEIAELRQVKVSTVRTLLKRAQDKVEARTLRDLVRILAGLAV